MLQQTKVATVIDYFNRWIKVSSLNINLVASNMLGSYKVSFEWRHKADQSFCNLYQLQKNFVIQIFRLCMHVFDVEIHSRVCCRNGLLWKIWLRLRHRFAPYLRCVLCWNHYATVIDSSQSVSYHQIFLILIGGTRVVGWTWLLLSCYKAAWSCEKGKRHVRGIK